MDAPASASSSSLPRYLAPDAPNTVRSGQPAPIVYHPPAVPSPVHFPWNQILAPFHDLTLTGDPPLMYWHWALQYHSRDLVYCGPNALPRDRNGTLLFKIDESGNHTDVGFGPGVRLATKEWEREVEEAIMAYGEAIMRARGL